MVSTVIVDRDVMVPMRDKVNLATDIYRPDGNGRHPVLVHRTPYGKSTAINVASRFFNPLDAVLRGYVVVIQDVRGRFSSEGSWEPFANELNDGYDTVEWAASQPWADGQVGIYGGSYVGVTALHAAISAPPHLKACMVSMFTSNRHNCWTYTGGAFELGFNLFWIGSPFWGLAWDTVKRLGLSDRDIAENQKGLAAITADPWGAVKHLPIAGAPAFKTSAPYWDQWLNHPTYDDYWRASDVTARDVKITVPVLNLAGWFDLFLLGSLELNDFLKSHSNDAARAGHRLVIGPWEHVSHLNNMPSSAGQWDFGPEALAGPRLWTDLVLGFFDQFLKPDGSKEKASSKVRYFMMGENEWRESPEWPPDHIPTPYYLHSRGSANTRSGDGVLTTDAPLTEPGDGFSYDPADPVPSVAGRVLFYHFAFGPAGVANQATVEERPDVLVYTTTKLNNPLRIAGPVTVKLFATSSAVDTDFTAKLVDVQPDGFCANIAEGIIRARYRNNHDHEELLEPGKVYEFRIDLWSVAHTFGVGHSIRLEVSSSNFPRFNRNLNAAVNPANGDAAAIQVAQQEILHDAAHPSHLLLPVLR